MNTEADDVPRFARAFAALLIAAMIASAAFVWEPWPLTSFRLFSHLRTDEQAAWHVTAVEADGTERAYPLDSLDRGFRNFGFRMSEFVYADQARRDELCRTWVAAAPDLAGVDAVEVRLHQRRWLLSWRDGDRARPGSEELIFTCTREGARVEG